MIYNVTDITDGDVTFAGRSLGGSSIVADEDVVDAMLAGEVVASSGVGDARPGRARPLPRRLRRRRGGRDQPVHGGLLWPRRGARSRGALPARPPLHDRATGRPGRRRQRDEDVRPAHRGSRQRSRAGRARRPLRGTVRRRAAPAVPPIGGGLRDARRRRCRAACGATGSATPATGCSRSPATSTRTCSSISPAGTSVPCPRPVVPSSGSTSSRHRRPGSWNARSRPAPAPRVHWTCCTRCRSSRSTRPTWQPRPL